MKSQKGYLKKDQKENNYEYTVSTTFMRNSQACWTRSVDKAEKLCNIFLVENLFMMYFVGPNVARIHFYADKNYFDSDSEDFIVPLHEWVTI